MNQPAQQQEPPGRTGEMNPRPDHGEESYRGSGRLAARRCSYRATWPSAAHCRSVIDTAVTEFGRVDVLVSNAAQQMTHDKLEDITDEEWDRTLAVNLSAFFYLTKAALPHMRPGSSIIGTSSVNSDSPTPQLLPYDVTKAGIANMTAALAQLLAERGIRANSVAPGPDLDAADPVDHARGAREGFRLLVAAGPPGTARRGRAGVRDAASDEASYVSGARVAVTGGKPIL